MPDVVNIFGVQVSAGFIMLFTVFSSVSLLWLEVLYVSQKLADERGRNVNTDDRYRSLSLSDDVGATLTEIKCQIIKFTS